MQQEPVKKPRAYAADYHRATGYDEEEWERFKVLFALIAHAFSKEGLTVTIQMLTGLLGAALLGRINENTPESMKDLSQSIHTRRGKVVQRWKDMSPKDKRAALECVNKELKLEGIREITDMKIMNWRMGDTLRFRQRNRPQGGASSSSTLAASTGNAEASQRNDSSTSLPPIREILPGEFHKS